MFRFTVYADKKIHPTSFLRWM